ncbi:MAG TPA: hypothetical protein VEC16_03175 [Alphaproteobacteria bacterium]|nr:hypothetical protein [Alphaproteobacteria bacterium]
MLMTWGYDYFIGKAVDQNGKKTLICLDFEKNSIEEYVDLNSAGYDLYDLVSRNKRVLLYQSPGKRKEIYLSIDEMSEYLQTIKNTSIYWEPPQYANDPNSGPFYIRPEIKFETLTPRELVALRNTYRGPDKIYDYRDPFQNQPKPWDSDYVSDN